MDVTYLGVTVTLFILLLFSTIFFLAKLYKRCPSNKILVVYGRVAGSKTVQCYHGGGTFVWPLIQGSAFLDLTPRNIHIPLKGSSFPSKYSGERPQYIYSSCRDYPGYHE